MRDYQIYEAQNMKALSGIPNYQEWNIDSFMQRQLTYDRILVSIEHKLETLFLLPLEKNLVLVACRPDTTS